MERQHRSCERTTVTQEQAIHLHPNRWSQGHRTVVAADMEEMPEGLAEDAAQHRETWT